MVDRKTSILAIVGEAGLSEATGSVPTAMVKAVGTWWSSRKQDRLNAFHDAVFRGEDVFKDGKHHRFITQEVDMADFYGLLEAAVRDFEEEKVDAYANLFRAFVDGEVDDRHRRHFVMAAKELSIEEIEMLRSVHQAMQANSSIDDMFVRADKVFTEMLQPLEGDPLGTLSLDKLERLGFARRQPGMGSSEKFRRITATVEPFVESVSS